MDLMSLAQAVLTRTDFTDQYSDTSNTEKSSGPSIRENHGQVNNFSDTHIWELRAPKTKAGHSISHAA